MQEFEIIIGQALTSALKRLLSEKHLYQSVEVDLSAIPKVAGETVRPVPSRGPSSGLKAPNVTAGAEASPTSRGPGAQVVDLLGGLNGRNKSRGCSPHPMSRPFRALSGRRGVWLRSPGATRCALHPRLS